MPLSGKDMLKLFMQSGWMVLRQRGSHIMVGKDGQVAVIPIHKELKKGTEQGLLKQLKTGQKS